MDFFGIGPEMPKGLSFFERDRNHHGDCRIGRKDDFRTIP